MFNSQTASSGVPAPCGGARYIGTYGFAGSASYVNFGVYRRDWRCPPDTSGVPAPCGGARYIGTYGL
jgi:hypothetical protein